MSDKIQLLNPEGKVAPRIDQVKYDQVKQAIVESLTKDALSYTELTDAVRLLLSNFDGKIGWYTVSIKLDLEARGEVIRHAGKPEKYTLK